MSNTNKQWSEDSQATFAALCSKHPQGFPVEPEFASAPALDCLIPAEEVRKCLQAFSKSSAPGPSGLRAQHLLDAVCGAEQGAALHALESVVNILASGKVPAHCRCIWLELVWWPWRKRMVMCGPSL